MVKEHFMIQDKLTTKQFADMCKVEKRTLHYYDEIDLLKPIEIKKNGYRIYSSSQFDTMSMIKALQSVGMSLGDIKDLMNENDLSHCKTVLNNQIRLIKEKQEELKMAEQILRQTTEQLEHYSEIGCNQFFKEKISDIFNNSRNTKERLCICQLYYKWI
ncbi:MerR family transcriptional regulator [Clostridium bovifaecis]|uniref:MerR family transcriptional regulator n=1 Tax=Clostridium bovifaecis TaxID=2184719 RepID=A0A6I6F5L9_9CLOT|nr:MerR family transcriptional regulator [Clostridium bovifaecis]